jgi:formylglycine-generating enzyme required for sulfatase activity
MCYPPLVQIKPGMKLPADYLSRTGYRLPTEAEWKYACRAGAITSRFYGAGDELLPLFADHQRLRLDSPFLRALQRQEPEPNDLGLFGGYGGVSEWCQDRLNPYPASKENAVIEDQADTSPILDSEERVLRGGSSVSPLSELRSASRVGAWPSNRSQHIGFRVARTLR